MNIITTKEQYIKDCPKSYLAKNLQNKTTWPDNQPIKIIGGLIAPHTKCSNLYKALQNSKLKQFIIGGHRWRGTEGWWIAVA